MLTDVYASIALWYLTITLVIHILCTSKKNFPGHRVLHLCELLTFFVGCGTLVEGSFQKPVPPKIQDGCQVDILDFIFWTVTIDRIGRLIWNLFVGWASLQQGLFRKPVLPKIQDGCQVDILDFALSSIDAQSGAMHCDWARLCYIYLFECSLLILMVLDDEFYSPNQFNNRYSICFRSTLWNRDQHLHYTQSLHKWRWMSGPWSDWLQM
jgi:hypothetical protein